jgi:hypothetical protein
VRARGALAATENIELSVEQHMIGADLTVLKLFDPGYVSPGFGFRMGVDWVKQAFTTPGDAPTRQSIIGRASPVLRLERAVGSRASLIASLFVDGVLINKDSGRELVALPGGEIGFTAVFQ